MSIGFSTHTFVRLKYYYPATSLFNLISPMQINLNVPTLPTVNELANRAATRRAPRLSRPSNSLVSLLERVFSVNQIEEDPLPSPEEVAQIEQGMSNVSPLLLLLDGRESCSCRPVTSPAITYIRCITCHLSKN